ncbi:MAG: phosphotransferase [Actinomycetota bacterium]
MSEDTPEAELPGRTPLQLAALATAVIPGLTPTTAEALPGDHHDIAVLTDHEGHRWVVRAPHDHNRPALELDVEARLLPRISAHLLAPVPEPTGPASTPAGDPCLIHPYLIGRPLDLDHMDHLLAGRLGSLLGTIHTIDRRLVHELDLVNETATERRQRYRFDIERVGRTGHVPSVLLARWNRIVNDHSHWQFQPTLIHGNLRAEHILIDDDGFMSGVLSWGNAAIGDPAEDFAWLIQVEEPALLGAILSAYAAAHPNASDAHSLTRARLASELAVASPLLADPSPDVIDRTRAELQQRNSEITS